MSPKQLNIDTTKNSLKIQKNTANSSKNPSPSGRSMANNLNEKYAYEKDDKDKKKVQINLK